jgi:hypothetical protein
MTEQARRALVIDLKAQTRAAFYDLLAAEDARRARVQSELARIRAKCLL